MCREVYTGKGRLLSQGAMESCDEGSSQGATGLLSWEGLDVSHEGSLFGMSPMPFLSLADMVLCLRSVGDTSGEEEDRNIDVENCGSSLMLREQTVSRGVWFC